MNYETYLAIAVENAHESGPNIYDLIQPESIELDADKSLRNYLDEDPRSNDCFVKCLQDGH